jgi:hypothetical protein
VEDGRVTVEGEEEVERLVYEVHEGTRAGSGPGGRRKRLRTIHVYPYMLLVASLLSLVLLLNLS